MLSGAGAAGFAEGLVEAEGMAEGVAEVTGADGIVAALELRPRPARKPDATTATSTKAASHQRRHRSGGTGGLGVASSIIDRQGFTLGDRLSCLTDLVRATSPYPGCPGM